MSTEQNIGSYQILYRLGKGGSSEVFAAKGPWDQKVAIKIQRRPKKRRRFLQELDIPNSFYHPCLTPIYGYGINNEGWSYLVMDLIEGNSAATYTRKMPINKKIIEAVRVCGQVAEALGKMHEKNWIHGDIKSKNILIDRSRQPHLIDFELARPLHETGRGGFFGTRSYAPPEQHEGKKLTTSVDLYALACVLIRMITDNLPYERISNSKQAYIRKITPPSIASSVPPKLKQLLLQTLSPNPKDRPQEGYIFSRLLYDSINYTPPEPPTPKTYSLSELSNILKEGGLNVRSYIPHLYYFTGASRELAHMFVEQKKEAQQQGWVPPEFGLQWRKKLYEYPSKTIRCMILLAALGGNLRSNTLAAALNISRRALKEELVKSPDILVYNNGRWNLRFGALDSIILNHRSAPETIRLLNSSKLQDLIYCRIARYISKGNFTEACNLLRVWIDEKADTFRQWIFLQRLLRKGVQLEQYRKILLYRLEGDWIAALHLQTSNEAKQMLKCLESINQGAFHVIGTLKKLCRSNQIDVMIGARAVYSEWHIANGRFHKAARKLKRLCTETDMYPQSIGLQQRAIMHTHLAQTLMLHKIGTQLEQWSITDSHRQMIQRLKNGSLDQNHIPMDKLINRLPYLKARSEIQNRNPNDQSIEALPFSLSLGDRAALLSNPIWRDYEQKLRLPPSPKSV